MLFRSLSKIEKTKLIILIGQYSQKHYLKEKCKETLTDNVKAYKDFLPQYLPLVHPSPRNKIWQKKNPWFEKEIIPELQKMMKKVLK